MGIEAKPISSLPEDNDLVFRSIDDRVNHPSHYTFGDIEVIDYIRDKLTPEAFEGYCMGNVLKYCSRYTHKNGVEDLKKAKVYLDCAIETAKKREDEQTYSYIQEVNL